jgi:hypothetical protein
MKKKRCWRLKLLLEGLHDGQGGGNIMLIQTMKMIKSKLELGSLKAIGTIT